MADIISSMPKHEKIYRKLRVKLLSGEYKTGCKLPSERDLMSEYAVSRVTASHAMKRLAIEGLIDRGVGSGSFVVDRAKSPGEMAVVVSNALLRPNGSPYFRVAASVLMQEIEQTNAMWCARIHMADYLNDTDRNPIGLDLLSGDVLPKLRGVFAFNSLPKIADQLDQHGIPVVFMGIDAAFQWKYQVYFDFPLLYKQAMAHFKGIGCQTVGTLWQGPGSEIDGDMNRSVWFTDAAQKFSLNFKPQWMLREANEQSHPETLGYELFHRFWRLKDRPQALFVSDEVLGAGVLRAALELGVHFPDDLKLIVAATHGLTFPYHKQVTRIELDPDQQIQLGLDLMSELLGDQTVKHRQVFIPGRFVQGDTA